MSRSLEMAAFAVLSGCTLLASPSAHAAQDGGAIDAGPEAPVVATIGIGETTLAPDMATVWIAIRTVGSEPGAASRQNEELAAAVADAIASAGLGPDSVRATGLRIGPNREYTPDGPRDRGFFATRSLRATTRDLDAVGTIIDAALGAGATSVDRVVYGASAERDARRRALIQAVEEARDEAEIVAAASGGSLGRMLRLSTRDASVPRALVRGFGTGREVRGGAAAQPEDLTVTAVVSIDWELLIEQEAP